MSSAFWIILFLFLIGFLHGLHCEHVQEILAYHTKEDLYRQMGQISFASIIDHLSLFLPILLPLMFLRFFLSELDDYSWVVYLAFMVFAAANFYLFFFRKLSLHQHDHSHLHEHGHVHTEAEAHNHRLPLEMDNPPEQEDKHRHKHNHEHTHLHAHKEGEAPRHQHKHYPGIGQRILELRNIAVFILLTPIIFVFTPIVGGATVLAFLTGVYLSIYLLSLIYIAGGIVLMEKCISTSHLLSGAIGIAAFCLF